MFPSVICKDVFVLFIFIVLVLVMLAFLGVYSLCHVDNSVEVNGLVTPFHIVPEWYLLLMYGILKGVPSRPIGVLFMLLCIVCLMLFCEFKNVSTVSRLFSYLSLSVCICLVLCFIVISCIVWIACLLSCDVFVSFVRICNMCYVYTCCSLLCCNVVCSLLIVIHVSLRTILVLTQ